jgi:hypothetical protein
MSAVVSQEQQDLNTQIAEVRETINRLKEKLRRVDAELEGLTSERERYQLLGEVCNALDKLEELGAADLFWGDKAGSRETMEQLGRVRGFAAAFAEKLTAIEQRRKALQDEIDHELLRFDELSDELFEQQEREENIKYEFVVDRELVLSPYAAPVMPWTEEAEDRRRLRKSLLIALLVALLFGTAVTLWVLPPPQEADVTEIPERLVKLVQREKPKPPEPKPLQPQKPTDKKEQTPESKTATEQARNKAEQTGILAFKNSFADLMDEGTAAKLGADAQISDSGQQAVGQSQRSLVVAQARGGSGGINTASLSRNVGGTGRKVGGVQFARVESSVGGLQEAGRPLSDGAGPSRTDEEIQIVFDRYKAALYRIYNRELRNDPTLKGKMVLRLTIEPGGEVSACSIESTDLASAALKTEVVERVKRFNFGPKEGVPRITILYPIDFLPAT